MSLFSSNDEHFCTPFALHSKINTRTDLFDTARLEPENELGNVEYKLRLTDPTPERIERLVTQLKWRIREGHGEAILYLGVKDDGLLVGLTPEEVNLSLQTLERMSSKIGAKMVIVSEHTVEAEPGDESAANVETSHKGKIIRNRSPYGREQKENSFNQRTPEESCSEISVKKPNPVRTQKKPVIRKVIQVLVKRRTHDISEELRVAVLGPTESGKSTLLGVLSHGEYDNGRGSARLNLFRHRHEVRSGHTSSISQEIFGFNSYGQPLTYSTFLTTEEIIEASSRVVTLIDLAGHQRYLNTTLFGLGSHCPDIVLIVVSAISTITSLTTDYISLALGVEKSLAIVINKVDLATKEDQEACYNNIVLALQSLHPEITPFKITALDEAIAYGSTQRDSKNLPIFFTSCVTGVGLSSLYGFFSEALPSLNLSDLNHAVNQTSELQVDETFQVPGIGTVVSGLMVEGIIREGDEMMLGPDDHGRFENVSIISLQRHKIPCNFARAGQKCTMAIIADNIKVRRGMVLKEVDHEWTQNFSICKQFEASINFLTNKQYNLSCGGQISVYVGNVRQTCSIMSSSKTADNSWLVGLELTKRPEYIREGSRLLIRYASIKGTGLVVRVTRIQISPT